MTDVKRGEIGLYAESCGESITPEVIELHVDAMYLAG
jgi:hypothetical protein